MALKISAVEIEHTDDPIGYLSKKAETFGFVFMSDVIEHI
jgi:hypothetical protein